MATVILKRKILVGLQSNMVESLERFETFFGITNEPNYNASKICRQELLSIGSNVNIKKQGNLRSAYGLPEEDTRAYNLLVHHNRFDIQIYNLAVSMFKEQRSLIRNIDVQTPIFKPMSGFSEIGIHINKQML